MNLHLLADIEDSNKVKHIVDNLLLCVELEGDGGFSSFTSKEKEEMRAFLSSLTEID